MFQFPFRDDDHSCSHHHHHHHHPLDWKAYILEDTTTSTRINGFLWNRVSQGYDRVVTDEPPFESWRAWRAGRRDHRPAPYRIPASSSVREQPSELDGVSADAVAAAAELATQGSSSNCGAGGGYDTGVRTVTAPPMLTEDVVAAASSTTSSSSSSAVISSYSKTAAAGSRRGVGGVAARAAAAAAAAGVTNNGNWDQEDAEELEYDTGYEDGRVLTTALTGPPSSQEWALPFPSWSSEPSRSQLSSSSSGHLGDTSRSMSMSTSGQGRFFRQRQISFKLNAPEDMELAVIQCTLTKRTEGVKNGKHVLAPSQHISYRCLNLLWIFSVETQLKVDYAENLP